MNSSRDWRRQSLPLSAAIYTERMVCDALMASTGPMEEITRTEALLKETPSARTT